MVLLDNGGRADPGRVSLAPPPSDLQRLVEHVVVCTYPPHARDWRIVPDLSPHLIVSVVDEGSGRRARSAIVGARSRSTVVDVSRRVVTVGVRLRPGTLPLLLRASAADLTDRSASLDDAFDARLLRDADIGADSPPDVLAAGLLRLVRHAAQASEPGPIGRAMQHAGGVRSMADARGRAQRTSRNPTKPDNGLPPKRALSIVRLYRALFAARARRSWAAAALEAGYADQAHLIRECRVLLGDSPSAWAARGDADSFKTTPARRG
jgi:AraC-like DNA-binding protein